MIMIRLAVVWGVLAGTAVASESPTLRRFEATGVEMAVPIRLVFYAPDKKSANLASEAVFSRFRQLNQVFSDYDPESEARRLCDQAKPKTATRVGDDLFCVISAAKKLSAQSAGAFDVTVGPLSQLWRRTLRRGVLPSSKRLADARSRVGMDRVEIDPRQKTVTLLKSDMRLDFGGIAKGYAIDAALEVLRRRGITRALVEAGGDIGLGDPPPGRSGWRIAIARLENDGPPSRFVVLANAAIAVSGDTWQYVEIAGQRYSHIIDPRTGIALTDHSSVTVIAPNAMTADALASAVSVLGPADGLKLIESLPETAALVVRSRHEKLEVFRSSRLKRFAVNAQPDKSPKGK
ncbi:MAG: FAD:protein FMN transferase [Pirellulales bacterium]|nr:FAD:protein FMN transferase [Pirellulales bacterium]